MIKIRPVDKPADFAAIAQVLTAAEPEPLEFSERVMVPAGTGGEDVVSLSLASVTGRVEKSSRGFMVTGWVEVEATVRCVRCLEAYPWHLRESLAVELLPLAVAPREEETQLLRADLDTRFFSEPILDLAELAAELGETVDLATLRGSRAFISSSTNGSSRKAIEMAITKVMKKRRP